MVQQQSFGWRRSINENNVGASVFSFFFCHNKLPCRSFHHSVLSSEQIDLVKVTVKRNKVQFVFLLRLQFCPLPTYKASICVFSPADFFCYFPKQQRIIFWISSFRSTPFTLCFSMRTLLHLLKIWIVPPSLNLITSAKPFAVWYNIYHFQEFRQGVCLGAIIRHHTWWSELCSGRKDRHQTWSKHTF